MDLRSEIQEELQSNPTLEELPSDGVSLDQEKAENERDNDESTDQNEGSRDELDFSKEFEILGKLDEDWRDYMNQAGGTQPFTTEDAEKRQHFMDSLVSVPSLQEHLMQQAEMADLPDEIRQQAMGIDTLYAVHDANGAQLALVKDRKLAFVLARQNHMAPVAVH